MNAFVLFAVSIFAPDAPSFSVEPGFIIDAADECVCYPCLCKKCGCDGGKCECRDGASCFCPCDCPCEKGKPCTCGDKCKCNHCPGKQKSLFDYERMRLLSIEEKKNFIVWIGVNPYLHIQREGILSVRSFHAAKPDGWQGVRGPAYVIGEYYEENGVGRLRWKETVDLTPRMAIPVRRSFSTNC